MSAKAAQLRLFDEKARYRWGVASRALAAVVGGYALTSLLTFALSLMLPRAGMAQPEAVLAASVFSFLAYAAIIMAAFHARSAARVWAWLIGAAVPLGLIVWLLMPGAAA